MTSLSRSAPANDNGHPQDVLGAADLNRYDPEAVARLYRGHPRPLLRRLWQTLVPIGAFLLAVLMDRLTGGFRQENQVRQRGRQLCELLTELGPAFIKAGQALSTRPDLVSPVVLEELSALQDQLPPFSNTMAMACVAEDLGAPVEQLFTQLSQEPISAASLGQVYKGQLADGRAVAVKVQRPGLREQITLDLYIVRNMALWIKRYTRFVRSDLVGLVDELGTRIFEEMDYIHEAENAERFATLHRHNQRIAVPEIHRHLTNRRVLTMEWMEGIKLTQVNEVQALGLDPEDMINVGVNCSLEQLLEHGYFHADPHPGNLLALADGRIAYLDFGMMSEVKRSARTGLIQAVVHLVNKDFDKLAKDFVRLEFLTQEVDLKPIVPAFTKVFSRALEGGVSRMDFKSVTDDLSGVMYRFPFQVPPYYALIIRSLVTLEGIALSINPGFKILGAAYPYFATRLLVDPDPELRNSLREMVLSENALRWERLDDLLSSAARSQGLDPGTLVDSTLNFLLSDAGSKVRSQLVGAMVDQLDAMGWQVACRVGQRLPQRWQLHGLQAPAPVPGTPPPLWDVLKLFQKLPSFEPTMLWQSIPRLLGEPVVHGMGLQLAQDLAERGVVRLVRDVLLPQQSLLPSKSTPAS
ncbi:MAG: AarF/ABC1/UbiB kinase family protein [Synechococcus sp. SB0662_bin_45]|nr:AarF/ABC1/UbiB kinase family protein [Cyanobacteria bacterium MAG IRC4_bin_6]MXW13235.1 AarF/ABC1/UbiB kinase family protein [Synechococcus sp. SB0668_bin_13]MYE22151.1 AarF/ABC1/UbiB kinase family protein [Synechococcus sp. SB0662_bin_45]